MFAVPRKIITQSLFIASLLLTGQAHASVTDTCFNFLNAQDYARAESEAHSLLQGGNLDRIDERNTQLCLGMAYYYTGYNQDALPAAQRVETLSQSTQELAVAYNLLGMIYSNLNDLDYADLYGQRALKAFRELGDKKGEATTLNNLGLIANNRNDTERALNLFQKALHITPKAEQAHQLNNIATIHLARKEYKLAIKLMRQAIAISRDNGDTQGTATCQINLGGVLMNDKQYAAAEKELLAGLHSMRLLGDKSGEANAYVELGFLAKKDPQRNTVEARKWFEKAETLHREIGNTDTADKIVKLLAGK